MNLAQKNKCVEKMRSFTPILKRWQSELKEWDEAFPGEPPPFVSEEMAEALLQFEHKIALFLWRIEQLHE